MQQYWRGVYFLLCVIGFVFDRVSVNKDYFYFIRVIENQVNDNFEMSFSCRLY